MVDRLSLDASDRARLSDSIETALRAGDGNVLVAVEGEERERAYSEARACPSCGVGLPELSPQSFSFNSPLGMCVDCNGLGSKLEVDPDLVVPDPDLSIAEGAIEPWGERFAREEGWTTRIAAAAGARASACRSTSRGGSSRLGRRRSCSTAPASGACR